MPASVAGRTIVTLPRGGTLVQTSIGAVQFGAPPETIKDALSAGLQVPSIYVMPTRWFARERGLTVAELEFPVYYTYFLHGRRVTAVCDADERRRLRAVLREALLGPERVDVELDYAPDVPYEARADLALEMDWFRRKSGTLARPLEIEDVIDFVIYDADGRACLGGGVAVQRVHGDCGPVGWRLYEGDALVAEIADVAPAPPPPQRPTLVGKTFVPPTFGLTVLGSSHGFDPSGKTTGFVLWTNRRGVLVDPPCDATHTLQAAGVPAQKVDAVILTHCHADHDAGVLQKILEAGRVHLYTTPTILGSFLRKYVALTGETEEQLRRLFVFRPVTIGAPITIHGAEFRFRYSLHSIPTIGFECYLGGKSFVYSADTLYDPPTIERLFDEGVLSEARRDALLAFPWHHSLILHEAGVPPIHTPAARLAELPDEIKERLRIIHVAEADLPQGSGLKLARTGFDHTIELQAHAPHYADAIEALDALTAIELFRDLPIERAREFLMIARREVHPAGALVIGQGEPGERFYIIVAGEAAVVKDGGILTTYGPGDFFGEMALVTGEPRTADVRAKTELVVFAIDRHDFLSFLRGTDLAEALSRLARNRELPSWDLMSENAVLRTLTATQRTQLQALLEPVHVAEGQLLWQEGQVEAGWLLESAEVDFYEDGERVARLSRGAFVGDVDVILRHHGPPCPECPPSHPGARAVVVASGRAFRVSALSLAAFLVNNPRVLLSLSGSMFVE